jgi:hypothetical protein
MLVAKNATPEATIAALTIPKDLPDDLSTASAPVEGGGNSRAERGAGRIGTIVRSGTAEGSDSTETSDAKPPNPCGISESELLFITGPSRESSFPTTASWRRCFQAVSQPQVINPSTKEERKFQGTAFVAQLLPTGE